MLEYLPPPPIPLPEAGTASSSDGFLVEDGRLLGGLPHDLIRVGLYESKTGDWRGVVLSRGGLAGADEVGGVGGVRDDNKGGGGGAGEVQTTLVLHVTTEGEIYGVGVGAERIGNSSSDKNKEKKGSGAAKAKAVGDELITSGRVRAQVSRQVQGVRPQLNKPVVTGPGGKKAGEEQEKTFLQK